MTAATKLTEQTATAPAPVAATRCCEVCGERLSTYNTAATCYAHTVGLPWRGPNNRP